MSTVIHTNMAATLPEAAGHAAAEGVIDLLPEPAALVGGDGRILHANGAFAAHLGQPRGALAGRPLAELSTAPANELAAYLGRCAGTLQPIPGGLALRGAEGADTHLVCEGAAVRGASGAVLLRCRPRPQAAPSFAVLTEKVHALTREVLRRKDLEAGLRRSEERLRLAVALARLGTWDLDLADDTMIVSERCRVLRGLPQNVPVGSPMDRAVFEATIHPADRHIRAEAIAGILADETPDYTVEYRVLHPTDPMEHWVAESGRAAFEDGMPVRLFGTTLDITQERRAAEHQRLLINELNHRVKNTLATVQSIAMQTLRHTPAPEAFRAAFTSRLAALSQAHNLLTETQWLGADLRTLIELETAPHETAERSRVRLSGPPLRIGPKAAVAFSLAFHELATNAAKYGALSVPQGWIEVTWSLADAGGGERRLEVRWRERDGPPVAPPTRRGFGSRVIEQGLAYDLNGSIQLAFEPEGVRCAISVPYRALERDGQE
ncbi:HWE histidine kinase domain-containing protein [Azospirillum sp. TSO22-1]|uniref:sensor histidine kinase n=1 Tax=Azospirillum sp. TSO22-1 TaxID=716789 RepID=UPI001304D087|nr:HWE histidine kinase domain-containing protein [Azospirillum sp. TSO22-1]